MNLVIKDAVWQIIWRVASALFGFIVIKLITPYLWPLRYGDYTTILKYFAIRSALADFWIYVIALKTLGAQKATLLRQQEAESDETDGQSLETRQSRKLDMANQQTDETYETPLTDSNRAVLSDHFSKFFSTRIFMIFVVFTLALLLAYFLPAYTQNPFLVRWLPFWMVFSASFMTAGMLQVPVQLFRKMEQLSIALVLARIGQIWIICVTIYRLYPLTQGDPASINAFMLILLSVIASGVIQWLYVRWKGKKFLTLRWNFDWNFTKSILWKNRQYGLAYYLSSFHTLIVLILLSWIYPTAQGYTYVGIWALGLSLIEILLVVPSSLGNSLIHKVSSATTALKRTNFWHLCFIVAWIGTTVTILFYLFSTHIINFIWWSEFLTQATQIGSDFLLPRLGIIITLSFIKQVHNYLFVSTGHQNTLLIINLVGVVVWLSLAVPLIMQYGLLGGLVAQGVLEVLFVVGSLVIARRKKVLLFINRKRFATLWASILATFLLIPKNIFTASVETPLIWLAQGAVITWIIVLISLPWLKQEARGL